MVNNYCKYESVYKLSCAKLSFEVLILIIISSNFFFIISFPKFLNSSIAFDTIKLLDKTFKLVDTHGCHLTLVVNGQTKRLMDGHPDMQSSFCS